MTDDSSKKYIRHIMSMRQLTTSELVNIYWHQAQEIARTGRLAFIIRGNVHWKSEQPEGMKDGNGIWLKPNIYDPFEEGGIIGEESIRESILYDTQNRWNIYEIWGTMAIDIDPKDASASTLPICQALKKITCVCNSMSFLYGTSLRWFPAVYLKFRLEPMSPPPEHVVTEYWDCKPLQRSQDESSTILFTDKHIKDGFFPFVDNVETMPPAVQTVIKTAIDWHAQANHFASGLNRFVNYWESIELLGNYFFDKLPTDCVERKTKSEKKDLILENLENRTVTRGNCMDEIKKCNDIRNPPIKKRLLAFLNVIADRDEMENKLFIADEQTGKSLYQIRNDIAHGSVSEHHFENFEKFQSRLYDAQKISGEIIFLSINNAEELARLINRG